MIRRLLEGACARLDRTPVRWTLGVALPVVVILLDPAVFHSRIFGVGMPILGAVKPYCYAATGLALIAFIQWLVRGQPSALASGVFAGGALFAVALGVAIAPFSLLGILFLGLGLLGFSPFLMAAVYARAARVALPGQNAPGKRLVPFLIGVFILLGVPGVVQGGASRAFSQSVTEILSGDAASVQRGTDRLLRWSLLLDLDRLVAEYVRETDPIRQHRIAAAYQHLTGQDVAQRAAELVD